MNISVALPIIIRVLLSDTYVYLLKSRTQSTVLLICNVVKINSEKNSHAACFFGRNKFQSCFSFEEN